MVKHFAKKQKETKTVAKEEDTKSNVEMIEGKNEISVRNIDGILPSYETLQIQYKER